MIVATSIGAADAQLVAACGIYPDEGETTKSSTRKAAVDTQPRTQFGTIGESAPDNFPPLSIPFVTIDEACQSVESASHIPIVSTNSCRSLVMLGDPVSCHQPSEAMHPQQENRPCRSLSCQDFLQPCFRPLLSLHKRTTHLWLESEPTIHAVHNVTDASNNTSYRKLHPGSFCSLYSIECIRPLLHSLAQYFTMDCSLALFNSVAHGNFLAVFTQTTLQAVLQVNQIFLFYLYNLEAATMRIRE